MEEPGTNKEDTFYVTHLREPIDRSISHFKYEGRRSCEDMMKNKTFVPTENNNAFKLETWNQTTGHYYSDYRKSDGCRSRKRGTTTFSLHGCAVDCYTQWFGGLNCARWQIPIEQQYEVAMSKLYKYNLIIVLEKLRDPKYAQAIESFFEVKGILTRGNMHCGKQSHKANEANPLVIYNETRTRLTELNRFDLKLYHEISDCVADWSYEQIPQWDGNRFALDYSSPSRVRRVRWS